MRFFRESWREDPTYIYELPCGLWGVAQVKPDLAPFLSVTIALLTGGTKGWRDGLLGLVGKNVALALGGPGVSVGTLPHMT